MENNREKRSKFVTQYRQEPKKEEIMPTESRKRGIEGSLKPIESQKNVNKRQTNRERKQPKKIITGIAGIGLSVTLLASATILQNYIEDRVAQKANSTKKEAMLEQGKGTYTTLDQEAEQYKETEDFLKMMYVELQRQMEVNTELTEDQIILNKPQYQRTIFVNNETGEYITHSGAPDVIEQKLRQDGIHYSTEENVKIYTIENTKGDIIDEITLKHDMPKKVIIGSQYEKPYNSVLIEMGEVYVDGLAYMQYLEKGDKTDIIISQRRWQEAIEKYETNKNSNTPRKKIEIEEELEH